LEIAELVVASLSLDLDLAPLLLAGLVLAPLWLAELESLGLALLEAVALVATDTTHHLAID